MPSVAATQVAEQRCPTREGSVAFETGRAAPWAIILAGGEGMRLRPLTRRIAGDERPKQFCPMVNGETLLDRTQRRVQLSVKPDRTCLVLTRPHERFYAPLVAGAPTGSLIVQPWGRGTAPAILYGLLRIAERASSDAVALFPSDHYVSDDARFMAHVEAAFRAVDARPDLVVLLGIEADAPEPQYGWIEPGEAVFDRPPYPVYRVRQFWEKPEVAVAERLLRRGCLWNSFVVVTRVPTLLALIEATLPDLYRLFTSAWRARSTEGEYEAMRSLYARLSPTNFSETVLGRSPDDLAVLPVRGVAWSDWGEPGRVLRTLARLGLQPEWAKPEAPVLAAGGGRAR
jgi:mannose-1-phosphate guanylyltransferase